jgi:2-polyprenyl-3-methyl-5-hydroxy-6-metoxy-1,4-benzoquinol methylase
MWVTAWLIHAQSFIFERFLVMSTVPNLIDVFEQKYGAREELGWGPRLRLRFGYFNPDDIYEAYVSALVNEKTQWLDVGCGRDIFPSNRQTAKRLSERCRLLVGLDPSENINENTFVHHRVRSTIENFNTGIQFDLVTMRMVAEHIADPHATASALAKLVKPGGSVVIYTVHRWSPVSMISTLVPFALHHYIKRVLWKSEEKDTFPTEYRMNTRTTLRRYFEAIGFKEKRFAYLDDCRTFARWLPLSFLELALWKALHSIGIHYPEFCILGIYENGAFG